VAAQAETLAQLFWDSVQAHGSNVAQEWCERDAAGQEAWRTRTYHDLGRAVRDAAHALLAMGLRKGDRVAIWSKNSPRWAEVDFANLSAGFVTVPIYDTLTPDKAAHLLADSEAKVLFVADGEAAAKLAPHRERLKRLQTLVVLAGGIPAGPAGKGVVTYESFLAPGRDWGQRNPAALDKAVESTDADDLASLVYTSGTTGEPKGAMLTHGNFCSNAVTALSLVDVGPYDVFLSFLPLSHVFERTGGHFLAYGAGAKVVFARSIDTLSEDLVRARPTLMMSVPRLYEKMHARVLAAVAEESWIKRRIFAWAIAVGREAVRLRQAGQPIPPSLARKAARADRLVFRKLRERVGGRLRYFVSGGAALSREIESFFWAAGITILQGYGLTETAPVTNVNLPTAFRLGSVGRCIPGVECRIDTQDWDATGKPHPEGEICFKGPNVMQGYWRNERATREAFDAAGWFHTGDVGYVDPDGYLWITDRKKEILVLSNGKKVAPQPIENALQLQPHIGQAMVLGEGRNYVATLVVPDWEALERFALRNGIAARDPEALSKDQRVVSLIESEVEAVNRTLSRYEQVKKFWIVPAQWTPESGELTPTLKLRRKLIQERFAAFIDRLYPGAEGAPSDGVAGLAVKA